MGYVQMFYLSTKMSVWSIQNVLGGQNLRSKKKEKEKRKAFYLFWGVEFLRGLERGQTHFLGGGGREESCQTSKPPTSTHVYTTL